jgi:hypothetical protein
LFAHHSILLFLMSGHSGKVAAIIGAVVGGAMIGVYLQVSSSLPTPQLVNT